MGKTLPFEILEQMFHHLPDDEELLYYLENEENQMFYHLHNKEHILGPLQKLKSDLESCMMVCKSWNKAATDVFWGKIVVVTLCQNLFDSFVKHLEINPAFALKDKKVQLATPGKDKADLPGFKAIVTSCHHLKYLLLASGCRKSADYLQVLNCQDIQLPYLQGLNIYYPEPHHGLALEFPVFYKFNKQLKGYLFLDHLIKRDDPALSVYGGLNQYLCSFPELTNLVLHSCKGLELDLPLILESCKHIKTVEIMGNHHFKSAKTLVEVGGAASGCNKQKSIVNRLLLHFDDIDLKTLGYIAVRLSPTRGLSLYADKKTNRRNITFSEGEIPSETLSRFLDYCKTMEEELGPESCSIEFVSYDNKQIKFPSDDESSKQFGIGQEESGN